MLLKQHFSFLYNGGLDPQTADNSELRQRRTFAVFILSLSPVACLLMFSNTLLGSESDNIFIATGLIFIFMSLYVQAYFNSPLWATNITLFTYWLVVFSLFFEYGLIATPLFWLFPIAPMAILLAGIYAGWIWCVVCILTLFGVWALEANSILVLENSVRSLINPSLDADSGLIFAGDGSIILLVLTTATAFFKRSQSSAESKLQDTVQSLQKEVVTRRIAEQTAINSEKAKTAFLAAMGHELRTPLNGIIGASRILSEADSQSEREEFNEIILQSGETLLELINNVMDLSSLESGKVVLESRPINIRQFVEQTLSPFRFQSSSKNLELLSNINEQVPEYIMGDPTRLRQIIINLIGNALKFTPSGNVSLSVRELTNQLEIQVVDTGIGIPLSVQPKLFEPYVQADANTTRKYGGSGLGLAIVKRLTEAMNGAVKVESKVDEGTCFSIILPLINADEKNSTEMSSPKPILPRLSILVVDDNAVNRMVLARILEKDNHQVVSVTNGIEATDYASNHELDLILMDIQMPEMDGLTATRTIRQYDMNNGEKNTNTPIIAITANLTESDKNNAIQAGMNGFVSKPFRYEELISVIQNNLRPTQGLKSD